jgi:hypothetical protein
LVSEVDLDVLEAISDADVDGVVGRGVVAGKIGVDRGRVIGGREAEKSEESREIGVGLVQADDEESHAVPTVVEL